MAASKVRKLPIKTASAELEGDYEGWNFTFRVNPPMGKWVSILEQVSSFDEENQKTIVPFSNGLLNVVEALVTSWDFVDENGKSLELCRDSVHSLPNDLIVAMFGKIMEGVSQAPLAINGNSQNGLQ